MRFELLPCPFCGNDDNRVRVLRVRDGYRVICDKCGASGTYIAIKDWHSTKMIAQVQAVKAWNTRPPVYNVEKVVERLEKELKLADEEKRRCITENPLQFDCVKGYATGIYNAIEIVRNGGKE